MTSEKLVEQLREIVGHAMGDDETLREAASEIERLEKQNESLYKVNHVMKGECESLTQTVQELREALELTHQVLHEVCDKAPGYDWNADPLSLTLRTGEAFAACQQALASTGKGEK